MSAVVCAVSRKLRLYCVGTSASARKIERPADDDDGESNKQQHALLQPATRQKHKHPPRCCCIFKSSQYRNLISTMFRNVISGLVRQRMAMNGLQRRTFAGGHGPKKEWTGIDKTVRSYFPEDHQLAIAILSGYAGLIVIVKIKNAITRKPIEQ